MRGFIAFPKSVPEGAKFRNTPQLAAGIGILRIMEVYFLIPMLSVGIFSLNGALVFLLPLPLPCSYGSCFLGGSVANIQCTTSIAASWKY